MFSFGLLRIGVAKHIYSNFCLTSCYLKTRALYPKLCANIHLSAICYFKQHKDSENEIAHKVMENNDAYSETVVKNASFCVQPQLKYALDPNKAFSKFFNLTLINLDNRNDIDSQRFMMTCSDLAKSIPSASFEELLQTLYCLCFWPNSETVRGRNYKLVWNMLDRECCRHLNKWSTAQKLLVADYWYHLRLSRITHYNLSLIKDLIRKRATLNDKQLVQLLFLTNLQRNVPESLMLQLQNQVEQAIETLSIPEISLICLGFFKSNAIIQNNNIINAIINRVIPEMENIDSPLMVSILKCVRKSFKINMSPLYLRFLNKCGDICQQWDVSASVHAALLCSTSFIFEPRLLNNSVEKLRENISLVRIKDISKLLQCHSLFDHPPCPEFNDLINQEFLKPDREEEFFVFSHDSLYVPVFYSYMGLYNYDVMKKVMSEEVTSRIENTEHRALLHLDCSIEIECEDYNGPRLKNSFRDYIAVQKREEAQAGAAENNSIITKVTNNVLKTLESYEDAKDNVCSWPVLPHMYNADIIMRLSPKSNSVPLSDIFKKNPYGIVSVPSGETWVAFVISGLFSFPFNSHRPCGLLSVRLRQLKKLGYKTIVINFRAVPQDEHGRKRFLKEELDSLIKKENIIAQ